MLPDFSRVVRFFKYAPTPRQTTKGIAVDLAGRNISRGIDCYRRCLANSGFEVKICTEKCEVFEKLTKSKREAHGEFSGKVERNILLRDTKVCRADDIDMVRIRGTCKYACVFPLESMCLFPLEERPKLCARLILIIASLVKSRFSHISERDVCLVTRITPPAWGFDTMARY